MFEIVGTMIFDNGHSVCRHRQTTGTGFRHRLYPKGTILDRESAYANFIMFVMKGCVEVNYMLFPKKRVNAGEMFLIPVNSFFTIHCLEDVEAVTVVFEGFNTYSCEMPFSSLKQFLSDENNGINILPVRFPVEVLLQSVKIYINDGVTCQNVHRLKIDELFLILRYYYSNTELAKLFHLILGDSMNFRMFCFRNISKVKSVAELVRISGMSRSQFYDKFKMEFHGMSPKKWLNSYVDEHILHVAGTPEINVKDLMTRTGFIDDSAFTQYCRRHFQMSPLELIRSRGNIVNDL